MIVEIDGTTSPQIKEIEGITGRESLKPPTEYKECNVVVIEKLTKKTGGDNQTRYEIEDRWTGAMYGKWALFASYVHEAGMRMGQMNAAQVVFIADGARHNWEIQMDNFHDAIQILDVYHALEHLGDYCDLFENKPHGKQKFGRWRKMMLAADTLQLLHEMKEQRKSLSNRDEGQKHINSQNKRLGQNCQRNLNHRVLLADSSHESCRGDDMSRTHDHFECCSRASWRRFARIAVQSCSAGTAIPSCRNRFYYNRAIESIAFAYRE